MVIDAFIAKLLSGTDVLKFYQFPLEHSPSTHPLTRPIQYRVSINIISDNLGGLGTSPWEHVPSLSDGAKCQRCFRFWSIEFSSPVVVSKINTIFHSRPYYESLPHPECSSGTIYLYLTNVFLFFLGLRIRGGELKEAFVSLQNLPCLGQKLLPFIVLLH